MIALPVGLVDFLIEQPDMRIVPGETSAVRMSGAYTLDGTHPAAGRVTRTYDLTIEIPSDFPMQPPVVFEVGSKIPHEPDYHVNSHDHSLCLGSPLALRRALRRWPNLQEFLARTLTPYLYAVTLKLDTGEDFVFGELRHGIDGQIQDLADDLQIPEARIAAALELLSMPSELADIQICPCNCGRLLGECELRRRLNEIRDLTSETWLRNLRSALASMTD
jgi:hypothetical protein